MARRRTPPALATWLVARSVGRDERDQLVGDLSEQFERRREKHGASSATAWYWTQAAGLFFALGPRRVAATMVKILAPGTLRAATGSLRRSPASSLASTLILAIGIAAPVSMFALADGSVHSLPGDPDDRVVRVSQVDREGGIVMGFPWDVYEQWRIDDTAGPAGRLAAFSSAGSVAIGDGENPAGRSWGAYVTPELFELLGATPQLGRLYGDTPDGGLPSALIREDLWASLFDRDNDVLGRIARIDGVQYQIVGVLPQSFGFPIDHSVWLQPSAHSTRSWSIVGRLNPDASGGALEERLWTSLSARDARPGETDPVGLWVETYTRAHLVNDAGDDLSRDVGRLSFILVLLTALTVGAVMLARGIARTRETSIRVALGASRLHIVALTVVESLLLCAVAGVLGLALGRLALNFMAGYLISQVTIEPYWIDFSLDGRSILLVGFLVLGSVLVAGLAPALHTSAPGRGGNLRASPGVTSRRTLVALTLLVGVEATLSSFLLTLAGQAVAEAQVALEYGHDFPTEDFLTVELALEPPDYATEADRIDFVARMLDEVRSHPSVLSASWTTAVPGKEGVVRPATLSAAEGGEPTRSPVQIRSVSDDHLESFGVTPSSGRGFNSGADASSEPVALVNEAFARRFGLADNAVGQSVVIEELTASGPYPVRIIGTVADRGITPQWRGNPLPALYLSSAQSLPRGGHLVVRTREGTSLAEVWQETAWAIDPYLPLGAVLSVDEQLRRGHAIPTLFEAVFTALGAATLLVALVGLYGLHGFYLSQRSREFGLRRALGAQVPQLAWRTLRRGLNPVVIGVVLGTIPGLFVARAALPLGVHGYALLLGPPALLVASLLAIWRLTWNASVTDPMDQLRDS